MRRRVFMIITAVKQIAPAKTPMTKAPSGPTAPAAGVMVARPATMPVTMPIRLGLPYLIHSMPIQTSDAVAAEMEPLRKLFNKSVVIAGDLDRGTVLAREHLALKKPGTGIPAREIERVIGKKLLRDLPADHLLSDEDLGDA